ITLFTLAIIVCLQTDNQLRVDCIPDNEAIATAPARGYEFTSSAKGKEIILATNLTNKENDAFRGRISVSDLRPGFRMTVKEYKLEEANTAFICKGIGQKQLLLFPNITQRNCPFFISVFKLDTHFPLCGSLLTTCLHAT
uniref:Uncharacterized protein n=1 Tax=Erpetoichthys calabaricus TaxID=27687 RepID=A0A8C4SR17_ERPCA